LFVGFVGGFAYLSQSGKRRRFGKPPILDIRGRHSVAARHFTGEFE
jgi:hypothetical protein